jgi:hypothetical protein
MSPTEEPVPDGDARLANDVPTTALKLLVGDRSTNVCSYAWRLWARGTSFYVKPLFAPFATHKISLHGPDSRHPAPFLSIGRDRDAPTVNAAAVVAEGEFAAGRVLFPGHLSGPGARLVVRIRVPWLMLNPHHPSAPVPPDALKPGQQGLIAPPPPSMRAVDFDLYVCDRRPWWPNEKQARRDGATLGPLTNEAGQHLTGVCMNRSVATEPTPREASAPAPLGDADRTRGLGMAVDHRGFLWIVEQWMSSAFVEASRLEDDV